MKNLLHKDWWEKKPSLKALDVELADENILETDSLDANVLFYLVANSYGTDYIDYILSKKIFNLNHIDSLGNNIGHISCNTINHKHNNFDFLLILLKHGININKKNKEGESVIDVLFLNNIKTLITELEKYINNKNLSSKHKYYLVKNLNYIIESYQLKEKEIEKLISV